MAAYRRVYDSRHLQADSQEPCVRACVCVCCLFVDSMFYRSERRGPAGARGRGDGDQVEYSAEVCSRPAAA